MYLFTGRKYNIILTEISNEFEEMKYELALALQRITVLEKKLLDCENDKLILSKSDQRCEALLNYLEIHNSITSTRAMKILKVTHHSSAHRVMKICAANNNELQLSKTQTGKLVLKKNKRLIH